jgi:DNA-binding FadR family transcriptional regulator
MPTQDEMAYRIGTVREVLCRGLHKLEKDNLIKVKRGKILVNDINKLREMVSLEEDESLFPINLPMKGF